MSGGRMSGGRLSGGLMSGGLMSAHQGRSMHSIIATCLDAYSSLDIAQRKSAWKQLEIAF